MRNLRVFFVFLALAVFMAGCNKQPAKQNQNIGIKDVIGNEEYKEDKKTSKDDIEKMLDQYDEACMQGPQNINACMQEANLLYEIKRYNDAAHAYDQLCVATQHIPACLKLAAMLEDGVGVAKNHEAAQKIYRVACYRGDKPSCKKIKE